MRMGLQRGAQRGERELRVLLGRGEALNEGQARRLHACGDGTLLGFRYGGRRGRRGTRLFYGVTGLVSLREHLSHAVVDERALRAMVEGVTHVLGPSVRGRDMGVVVFDPRHVYVDGASRLRFACVPLDGVPPGAFDNPLTLVAALGDTRRVRYRSADAVVQAERLAGLAREQRAALSAGRLHALLADELARAGPADAGDADVSGTGSHVLRDLGTGMVFPLVAGRWYRLGRGTACEVCLRGHARVSRVHASLRCGEAGVSLVDEGSTNGTTVGGRRLRPQAVAHVLVGQRFYLSDAGFLVERSKDG